jgi:hypothetical protein
MAAARAAENSELLAGSGAQAFTGPERESLAGQGRGGQGRAGEERGKRRGRKQGAGRRVREKQAEGAPHKRGATQHERALVPHRVLLLLLLLLAYHTHSLAHCKLYAAHSILQADPAHELLPAANWASQATEEGWVQLGCTREREREREPERQMEREAERLVRCSAAEEGRR